MKPYLIKWIDITEDGGWHTAEEFNDVIKDKASTIVTQVGFLYSQNKKLTIVVDSWIGNGEDLMYGVIYKIPTDCIIELKELTYLHNNV